MVAEDAASPVEVVAEVVGSVASDEKMPDN